jgi:hypothetical protein
VPQVRWEADDLLFMLMIELIANTMLLTIVLGLGLVAALRGVGHLNELANRSVVRIETRNMDHDLRRFLDD